MKQTFIVRILFFTLICPPIFAGKNGQQNDDATELKQTPPKKTEKPATKATTNPNVKYVKVQNSTTTPVVATTLPTYSSVVQSDNTANADSSPVTPQTIPSAATDDVPQTPKSATFVTPTQVITTHDVRFNKKRASYIPIQPYVPEQGYFGIGYDTVLKEVLSVNMNTKLSPVDIETHRTRVGKALRDIYGYLNKAIHHKQFNEAQKQITTLIDLVVAAHNRSLLPEDKRDNICAWLNRYHDSINQYETTQTIEINKWRYKTTKENNNDQKIPNVHELAITLGLQDDYMQALKDLENLDPQAITTESRPSLSATINSLLSELLERAKTNDALDHQAEFVSHFKDALTNAHSKKISLDPEHLVAANTTINIIKQNNRNAIKKAILFGKQLESQLKKTQTQTFEIAQQSFGKSVTDQFTPSDEKSDDISFEAFLASFKNDDQKEV